MSTANTLDQAWSALRQHFDRRAADLCGAVRSYPGPIARCDEQLTQLITERDVAVRLAAQAAEVDSAGGDESGRDERIGRFAAAFQPGEDAPGRALRAAVLAAGRADA